MKPMKWRGESLMPDLSAWVEDVFGDNDRFFKGWNQALTVPAVNIQETDHTVELVVAVPGMKKEDFKLSVDRRVLTVSAELKEEKEEEQENFYRREFNFHAFKRSFWLPEFVAADQIEAMYENGLLKISLPKIEKGIAQESKTIKIQ